MINKTEADGISIREFARRESCDKTIVRRAITAGRLAALPNGNLNPSLVGTPWRGSRSKQTKAGDTVPIAAPMHGETIEEEAKRLTATAASQFATKADAEKVKETYLALLRKLEFDEKSGEVVKISSVAKRVGEEYARVRSRLISIPAEVAPALAAMKTAEAVRDFLEKEITQVLMELSADDGRANT